MKTHVFVMLLIVLSGCAMTQDSAEVAAREAKLAQFKAWSAEAAIKRQSGEMSLSQHYEGMYDLVSRPPISEQDIVHLERLNALIPAAQQLEVGQITESQFQQLYRTAEINYNKSLAEIDHKNKLDRAESARQLQQSLQQFKSATVPVEPFIMQAPQTKTTNCQTLGSYTNCVTR